LPVIATTIIPGVYDTAQLVRFYDNAYSRDPGEAELYSRWRALGAVGKADHVTRLCSQGAVRPASVLEVGCGDGALLCELHRRGFCEQLSGVEISEPAVEIARARPELASVALYDGEHLPFEAGAFELGILSHVLEHVPEPAALLAEVARVCGAVIAEVPLEANWSARRSGKREHAAEVGHLQRLSRGDMRAIVARAGLSVAAELEDPLPLSAHRFFATTRAGRARAGAKWALRSSAQRLAPALARRAFTVHYACLCLPRDV
jgi:SAM-dependent methyltransferase